MAKTEHYHTQFEEGRYYHIYNRTIDKGKLFANEGNYIFFLKKFDEYMSDFVDTYSYCLLGNHFHFLMKILPEQEIKLKLKRFEELNPSKILAQKKEIKINKTVHEVVSHQLKKFFQSYAMAYNKQQNRVGTLFQKPFKRALVDDDKYFTNLIYYIHNNPQKHGLISDFKNYEWSSYKRIMIDKPTKLRKKEVLEWFGNKEMYLRFHDGDDNVTLPDNWDLDE